MPTSFTAFDLDPAIMRAITELGFEEATPVQEQVIPLMLQRKDVIAQAQTGTGKTAAFGLPILQRLDPAATIRRPSCWRRRASWPCRWPRRCTAWANTRRVSSLAVYGGQPIERQLRALRQGVQIVIGTPGRIMDHIRRGTLALDRVCDGRFWTRPTRCWTWASSRISSSSWNRSRRAPDRPVLGHHAAAHRRAGQEVHARRRSASPSRTRR